MTTPSAAHSSRLGSGSTIVRQVLDLARNVALLLGLYIAYALVRRITADQWTTALTNADNLIRFQQAIGLPSEATLQQSFFLDRPLLVRSANFFYMWAHFPVTAVFMLWVWFRHRGHFAAIRTALITLTMGGLILHVVFPLAPPRMKPSAGFVDTAADFGPNPYDLGAAEAANQIAAMPSLHVGWAVLVALGVIALSRNRYRYLIALHPILTTSVVVLTANHYWTDAAVAVMLVVMSWLYTTYFNAVGRMRQGLRSVPPPPTANDLAQPVTGASTGDMAGSGATRSR